MQESFKTVLVLKPSRDLSNILCCNLQIKVKECRMKFTGGVQNGYVGRPTWSEDGKVPGRVTTAQEPLKYTSIMEVNGDQMREIISTGREPGFGDKGAYPKGAFVVMGKIDNYINHFWTDGCSTIRM